MELGFAQYVIDISDRKLIWWASELVFTKPDSPECVLEVVLMRFCMGLNFEV